MKRFSKKISIHGEVFEVELLFEKGGVLPWEFSVFNERKCYHTEITESKFSVITRNIGTEPCSSSSILPSILKRIKSSDFNCYFALSNQSLMNEVISVRSKEGKFLVLQFSVDPTEDLCRPESKLWIVLCEHKRKTRKTSHEPIKEKKAKPKRIEPVVKSYENTSNLRIARIGESSKKVEVEGISGRLDQEKLEACCWAEEVKFPVLEKKEKKSSGRKYKYFVDKVLEDYEKITKAIDQLQEDNIRIRNIIMERPDLFDKEKEDDEEIVLQFLNASQNSSKE